MSLAEQLSDNSPQCFSSVVTVIEMVPRSDNHMILTLLSITKYFS